MKFTIFQDSRRGGRKSNQDRVAYSYSREALLMVVADGMGGHLYGEVAAEIVTQFITEMFQREASPSISDPFMFLSKAFINAHHAILDYAADRLNDEVPRTTCVACIIQDGKAYWAHTGDSRLYLLRGGKVVSHTRDHSRVQLMVEQGLVREEDAATHPARNRIYSCLGGIHAPQIDFSQQNKLRPGDVILLCTDGAWTPLGGEFMAQKLTGADIMVAVPELLDEAERVAGPHGDNLSAVALTWEEGGQVDTSSSVVSTDKMHANQFTTDAEGFAKSRGGNVRHGDLTDDEIERIVSEIQSAIQKYAK